MKANGTDIEFRAEATSKISAMIAELMELKSYILNAKIDTIIDECKSEFDKPEDYTANDNPFSFTPPDEVQEEQTFFDMYK